MGSTLTNLVYHIIFSTKGREPTIVPEIRDELYRYMGGIIKAENGALLAIGGMHDHIHMAVKMKPVQALSDMMRKVKGSSSKWINEQKRLSVPFFWQEGYGAFTVSESQISAVVRYIRKQASHHRKRSFQEELIRILEHHGVEYDERYIWK